MDLHACTLQLGGAWFTSHTVKLGNSDQVLNLSRKKKIVPDWISPFFLRSKPYQNFDKGLMTDLFGIFSPY